MSYRAVSVLALSLVSFACSQEDRDVRSDPEADVAAILAVNEGLLGALNDGDWERLNALTADDYVSVIRGRAVSGIENHRQANRRFLEQWRDEEAWLPDQTIVDGDLAVQRGSFTMTLSPRQGGGDARDMSGTYLHVYRRRGDGSWALVQAMAETVDGG